METNPYAPPMHLDRPRFSWRTLCKRTCLASLSLGMIFLVIGKLVTALAKDSTDASWFLIPNGLLALGELASWTTVGISVIGWIISRRSR